MRLFKILHLINKTALLINLVLYITVYFGMLFQIVLGFVQVCIAVLVSVNWKKLNSNTQYKLIGYWFFVGFAGILIGLHFWHRSDFGTIIFLFVLPMLIAIYFYFLTKTINNDSFLTAQWKNLALFNYAITPEILVKYVPKGTELDLWNGKCYVSLVGFMFENVKILGVKIPFHVNFEEVNLRFYVKRFENGEWKRGVVFIKEIVPKRALSWVANTVYKEHYQTAPMHHYLTQNSHSTDFVYQWKIKNKWNTIGVETEKNAIEIEANSEAEFITEHYFGYTQIDEQTTYEYEVKHPKWKQLNVIDFKTVVDFEGVYGYEFGFLKQQQPTSVLLAVGSEVSVENKKEI